MATYEKKTVLIKEGDLVSKTYFIESGIIRGFFTEESGEERTVILRPPKTFFTSPGILKGEPRSKYSFMTIEETTLIEFQFEQFWQASHLFLPVSKLLIDSLTKTC